MRSYSFTFLFIVLSSLSIQAQKPVQPGAADILLKLKKLNFLGSALYVAAHPDDENTRMIAYLANERLARTAYLSLTRGDGGQNLIGPEIREGLGVIRTQELLAARRIDGGTQFFSRANDFGYSKSAEETLNTWDRDQVLSDVVWVFRQFKPDVIITRFPPDRRAGHGHHTTSAIFAEEAFDLSGDKSKYPDQLGDVSLWKPTRLYTNTGRWWNPNMTGEEPGVLTVDVGKYNPLLGASYTEIAARSRSQHKSQGFGATGTRGESREFLEFRVGKQADKDLFEGIDTTWGRVKGGKSIEKDIQTMIDSYDPAHPEALLPLLMATRDKITTLDDKHWKNVKTKEIDQLIKDVLGLYLEVTASDYAAAPGDVITLNVEAVNRSTYPILLKSISYHTLADSVLDLDMASNRRVKWEQNVVIPQDFPYSQPYWLREQGTLGMYKVEERALRGTPENQPALTVKFELEVNKKTLAYDLPVVYKWNDPVEGEQYRPFCITPPVFVNIAEPVYIFPSNDAKQVEVTVKAGRPGVQGTLTLNLPGGWQVTPARHEIALEQKNEEAKYYFKVLPPEQQSVGDLAAHVSLGGSTYHQSLQVVDYDHIPTQMLLPDAKSRIVKIDIERKGDLVGYIQGAGDAIPSALREIGYEVWEMKEEEIIPANLEKLDAVILGIRALNTNERIGFYMDDLLDYVEKGGTMITQYNTSFRLKTNNFAPYPLRLSRGRVAEEDAEIRILQPGHPVLNEPNKITQEDFQGWVQERGLYFPSEWDDHYQAILSSNDSGEQPLDGGLLVAKYGAGYFIYSGYSWFRELPAGVPGAFRLFVNMVSLGNEKPTKVQYGHSQN